MYERLKHIALYRWWRRSIVGQVDHDAVMGRIVEDSGWSPRYAFMVMMQAALAKRLGEPLRLRLDQVVLEPGAGAIEAQREEMRQASDAASLETTRIASLSQVLALTAGIAPDSVTIDREHHRAMATAVPLPGATLVTYRTLERRTAAQADGWDVVLTPPQITLPLVRFASNESELDPSPARPC